MDDESTNNTNISTNKLTIGFDREYLVKNIFLYLSFISLFLLIGISCIDSISSLIITLIVSLIFVLILAFLVFFTTLPNILWRYPEQCSKKITIVSLTIAIILAALPTLNTGFAVSYRLSTLLTYSDNIIQQLLSQLPFGDTVYSALESGYLVWTCSIVLGLLSIIILYCIIKRLLVQYTHTLNSDKKSSTILLAIASALWALVPLLPLYQTNIENVSILFTILLALAYMIMTFIVYLISYIISKSALVSLFICIIMWFGLSLSSALAETIPIILFQNPALYSLILLVIMIAAGYGIFRVLKKTNINYQPFSKWILIFVIVLIMISAMPLAISLSGNVMTVSADTYNYNSSSEQPDIYWIHAESMVDTTVLEKYWGPDTFNFTEELEDNGFIVNHDAYLTGTLSSGTASSLLGLYSPSFYDAYSAVESIPSVTVALEKNNDFFNAFANTGYSTRSVLRTDDLQYIKSPAQKLYFYDDRYTVTISPDQISPIDKVWYYDLDMEIGFIGYSAYPIASILNSLHVQNAMTESYVLSHNNKLSTIIDSDVKNNLYPSSEWLSIRGHSNLIDALSSTLYDTPSPSLTGIYSQLAHVSYVVNETGSLIPNSDNLSDYYGQYLFSERLILYYVDTILVKNPNAIIIIVSDHGPHTDTEEAEMFFGPNPDYKEYRNHVLSAIRIPPQYQTEGYEEILKNPRNIVRYLINNYVGQNYEYLPTENYA